MKKIGILGGIGPESTIEYYRLIIKRYQALKKTTAYPEIIFNMIDMTEMLGYVSKNQTDELTSFLATRIETLEKAGAEFGAIASNTPHIVFDRVEKLVKIPMISIVEETCKEIKSYKMQRLGLLGTKSTMTSGFYNNVARKYNIEIVIPEPAQLDYIHEKYMGELVKNRILPETKKKFIGIVNAMEDMESIEGLILGGTELPLLLNQSDFADIQVFDTTKIHVESIVKKML
jgi:aspartate racemase